MALSFLLLQKGKKLQQILFCGPDFCGKIEGPEQEQEARAGPACSAHREVALGSVRISPETVAGSSPPTAAESSPWRAQQSACWKEKGSVVSPVLPPRWAAACPAGSGCCCELKGSLLHSLEHHLSPSLPVGSGVSQFMACKRLCRLQSLDLQCHRVVQKLQVMFGRF